MKSFLEASWFRASLGTILMTILIIFSGQAQTYDTTSYFHINSLGQPGRSITFVKKDSSVITEPTVADAPAQLWRWAPGLKQGYTNYYRLVNKDLGSALYLSVDKINDDFELTFASKKDAAGQLWLMAVTDGNSRFTCMWLASTRSLEITSDGELMMAETTELAPVPTQWWKLKPQKTDKPAGSKTVQTAPVTIVANQPVNKGAGVSPAKSGLDTAAIYRIITTEMPEKSLGIGANGGSILQAMLVPSSNHPLQEWKLVMNANGFYRITNQYYPSKSLEVSSPNETVVINETSNNKQQFWKLVLTHEGAYQITSVSQGDARALDFVEDGEVENEIQLRDFNSTIWTFIKVRTTAPAPKPAEKPVVISNNKNKLMAGEQLKENAKLISANGEYSLVQQPDGNLVIYNTQKKAMWASGMNGQNVKRCMMQKDGNLVQHPGGYDLAMWSTNTKGNAGAYAMLQDDGVLVIINKDNQVIWSSKN